MAVAACTAEEAKQQTAKTADKRDIYGLGYGFPAYHAPLAAAAYPSIVSPFKAAYHAPIAYPAALPYHPAPLAYHAPLPYHAPLSYHAAPLAYHAPLPYHAPIYKAPLFAPTVY